MKLTKPIKALAAILFLAFILPAVASAVVPQEINYQGYLTDNQGSPVADGNYNIRFALYRTAAGGSALWSETQTVFISDGVYSVQLGSAVSFPAGLFDGSLYLGVKVGSDPEMTPLQPVTSVAFALKAEDAEMLEGNAAGDFAPMVHPHSGADISSGIVADARIAPTIARDSEITWNNLSGIPAGFSDNVDNTGIDVETDPTVLASVKNGVSWDELTAIPPGFADDVDNTGITSESDPQVGGNTTNYVPKWNGTALVKGTIFDNGRIGIGTASPAQKMDVSGRIRISDIDALMHFNETSGGTAEWLVGGAGGDFRIGHGNVVSNNRFYIDGGSGNVGIGTFSPEAKFHVNGTAKFNVGGGSLAVTTPGGWPGMIANSPNGHRRDVHFYNDHISITLSKSSAPSPAGNGIRLYENGRVLLKVLQITGGSDLSEDFDVRPCKAQISPAPGMVVSIDPENPGDLVICTKAYDRRVAGIISGAGGVKPGMLMGQKGSEADGANPVALTGRVYCWVDASQGAIQPGDLLTSSDVPGHAMKVMDHQKALGAIIGKAMTSLEKGRGLVLVLASLQ